MSDTPSRTFALTLPDDVEVASILLPFDQRAVFGRARPPVVVTVNGYTYRSTIAVMNGRTFVPLRRSHREAAGLRGGETVEVTLALDTAPREVEMPADLASALEAARLMAAWADLSFTRQREDVEAIEGAKRPETRLRRIDAVLARLC